jgi:hypothetical protein
MCVVTITSRDTSLVHELPTESASLRVFKASSTRIAGVVINRTAVATIAFNVLVSIDGETWVSVGTFNINNIGYFTSNVFAVNAKYVKCRIGTTSAAIVVLSATLELMDR